MLTYKDSDGNEWGHTLVPSHVQTRTSDGKIKTCKIVYRGDSAGHRYSLEAVLTEAGDYEFTARTNGVTDGRGVGHNLESLKRSIDCLEGDLGKRSTVKWEAGHHA